MALLAKMERRVTRAKPQLCTYIESGLVTRVMRTYIVVAILNEKRDSFTCNARLILARLLKQSFLRQSNIVEQGCIGKRATRKRMHYRRAVGLMLHHRIKQGGSLQSCHCANGGRKGRRSINYSYRTPERREIMVQCAPEDRREEDCRSPCAH